MGEGRAEIALGVEGLCIQIGINSKVMAVYLRGFLKNLVLFFLASVGVLDYLRNFAVEIFRS